MTLTRRLSAVLLLVGVVLGSVLLLRPTDTTLAAWSDEVTVSVPALRTGGVHMDVTPATGVAATVGMAGDSAGTWRPSSVTVHAEGQPLTGGELAGSTVEYRLAGSGGSCATSEAAVYTASLSGASLSAPVTGGEQLSGVRTLCLGFTPSDHALVQLGGRALSFTTTIDGIAAGPATWTATSSWAADHQVAPGPSISGPSCSGGFLNQRVTLRWDWDRAGLNQDVSRWSLQLDDRGTWREVSSLGARQRSTTVNPYQFDFVNFDTYTLRVAAVLPDGTTIPATTSTQIRVERIGIGAAYCA